MGGISNVVKAGMPRSFKPKDMLKFGTPKSDIARQKNIWKATWSPQPAEGQSVPTRTGPTLSNMTPEELEELRRRRGAQSRRPSSTVLSSGSEDEALGG